MPQTARLQEQMLEFFARSGCELPQIGLLQPADPLLDTAGEDLRRRIFITAGPGGENLCLRPEFTIPVCLHHLRNGESRAARYGYAGTVFRQRSDEPAEFSQSGIEDIGNEDRVAADVAAIADCCEAVRRSGVKEFRLVLGDQSVFDAVLASLGLPAAWQKRLGRSFGNMALMAEDLKRLSGTNGNGSRLPDEIAGLARAGDKLVLAGKIAGMMDEAGLPHSSGRTAEEIAGRLIEKAVLAAARLDEEHRAALDAFLKVEVPAGEAADALRAIAAAHGLEIGGALDALARRIDALRETVPGGGEAVYRASFGRRLDYYTGMVMEIRCAGLSKPVAGGGRYDRLMTLLGAEGTVPAVGFSIWLDRLLSAQSIAGGGA